MANVDYSLVLNLVGAGHIGLTEEDDVRDFLIEALCSGQLDGSDLNVIANMLDPKGQTMFRLAVVRRKGNRSQADDAWYERLEAFWEIYEEEKWDSKEAVQRAQLSKRDGGIGVSESTARSYLKVIDEHYKHQGEPEEPPTAK
ncbi:MAG: hypothetical protein J0I45_14270 [Bosea sp.]|nr:hypothetical protein [Bosea sp. (in: a-proteobacteria)]